MDDLKNSQSRPECFISVDVETSGPIPGEFSLLSIGACVIQLKEGNQATDRDDTFYCILRPLDGARSDPNALAVAGLSLEDLALNGRPPEEAMLAFETWITSVANRLTPVFVGLNAPFD